MIQYNPKNKEQSLLFKRLYIDYITELSQYSKRLREQPITPDEIYDIESNPLLMRYFLTDNSNSPIGFLLLGFKENTQPGTDWYIAEFYIIPKARKQGYGQKAVKEMLEQHPGRYCYFILKENRPAHSFWQKMKTAFNWLENTSYYDARQYTPEDATFYAFTYPAEKNKKEI